MSKQILSDLSPEQKEAILYEGGPVLVLAGAGSGKTRLLSHRFAYLSKKVPANSMLTLTFTNRAAEEMKGLVSGLLRHDLKDSWIGTFQSQTNKILRKEAKSIGLRNDFSIYDEHDQCCLIRHILKEFKLYEALYKGVMTKISSLKSSLITPEAFLASCDFGFEERLARVYVRYQDEIKRCNALDHDDLIMLTIKLFEENPKTLSKYLKTFKHVLVDEFQETTPAQYRLLKLVGSSNTRLFAVADDDQSIYRFKGADINNVLSFGQDFPGARVVRLERNFRSTQNIIDVSDRLISTNANRSKKKPWTDRGCGDKVLYCWLGSETDEAKHIAKVIREHYLKGTFDFKDFAVLYRVASQSRAIEEVLYSERIPFRVVGGHCFYQRKEIKDISAYMRLAINNDDNVSLRRIINCPPRGIGVSTLLKIESYAKKKSLSLFSSINALLKTDVFTPSIKEKLSAFSKMVETLASGSYRDAADLIKNALRLSSYTDFVEDEKMEHVSEFVSSGADVGVCEFLDRLSLFMGLEETPGLNAVSVMTLHSAKGLEFPAVFITGLEEGLIPYFKAKSEDELAEERRLLYVGMTRAKEILWLTGAKKRRLYSKIQEQEPSRFIKDMPKECCQKIEKTVKPHAVASAKNINIKVMGKTTPYVVGSRVKHPKWGVGVIRDFHGDGEDQKVTVNFPDVGMKRLALKFAHLESM